MNNDQIEERLTNLDKSIELLSERIIKHLANIYQRLASEAINKYPQRLSYKIECDPLDHVFIPFPGRDILYCTKCGKTKSLWT